MRAYETLEAAGMIEPQQRSGHYVNAKWQQSPPEPQRARPSPRSTHVEVSELVLQILESVRNRNVYGHRWTAQMDRAIARLGAIIRSPEAHARA